MQKTAAYAPSEPLPREPIRTWGLRPHVLTDRPRSVQSLGETSRLDTVWSGFALVLVIGFLLWLAVLLAGIGTEVPAVPTPVATAQAVTP